MSALFTVKAAAQYLSVSQGYLRWQIEDGALKAISLPVSLNGPNGRRMLRVKPEFLEEFLANCDIINGDDNAPAD